MERRGQRHLVLGEQLDAELVQHHQQRERSVLQRRQRDLQRQRASPQVVSIAGTVTPASVNFNNNAVNYTLQAGSIGGFTSLIMNGSGSVTLAASNSYSGGTTINSGVVNANAVQALGTGPLAVSGGSLYANAAQNVSSIAVGSGLLALGVNNALPIAAPLTMGSTGSNGAFDMASFSQQLGGLAVGSGATAANQVIGNSVASSISTLTFSSSSSSTFGGTIQDGAPGTPGVGGQVALTVAGGLLNLSGSNTYSGLTTVSGGTLQLGSAAPSMPAPRSTTRS